MNFQLFPQTCLKLPYNWILFAFLHVVWHCWTRTCGVLFSLLWSADVWWDPVSLEGKTMVMLLQKPPELCARHKPSLQGTVPNAAALFNACSHYFISYNLCSPWLLIIQVWLFIWYGTNCSAEHILLYFMLFLMMYSWEKDKQKGFTDQKRVVCYIVQDVFWSLLKTYRKILFFPNGMSWLAHL